MNVYLVILLFAVLCIGSCYEIFTNKDSKIIAFISLCIFVVLVSNIEAPDTSGYIEAYNRISFENMHNGDFNIGFILLICVFKWFEIEVRFFFGVLALINYVVVYITCKSMFEEYRKTQVIGGICMKTMATFKPCVFSALFIPYFGIFYSGAGLRAGLAMSFVLASYVFLYKQKYLGYFALLIVAMLFHSSAVLGVLLLLCNRFTSDKQQVYMYLWIGSIVIWLSHISLFIVKLIPIITHKLYELTNIKSFKLYELFYASSIRANAFWGKKELFFLLCGLALIATKWDRNKFFHKVLTVFIFGIILAFSIEYITNSYRIIDYFLMFFVPCGCISLMKRGTINNLVWKCCGLFITLIMQMIITINIIGLVE